MCACAGNFCGLFKLSYLSAVSLVGGGRGHCDQHRLTELVNIEDNQEKKAQLTISLLLSSPEETPWASVGEKSGKAAGTQCLERTVVWRSGFQEISTWSGLTDRAKTSEDFASEFNTAIATHRGKQRPAFHFESFTENAKMRLTVQKALLFLSCQDFKTVYGVDPHKRKGLQIEIRYDETTPGVFLKDTSNPFQRVLLEHTAETSLQRHLLHDSQNIRPSQGEKLMKYFDADLVAQRPKSMKVGALTEEK